MGRRADKPRTLAQQAFLLGQLPLTSHCRVARGRLRWEGRIEPTVASESYLVRIDFRLPGAPQISVLSPPLEAPADGQLPHVYEGDRLCLCYPHEWRPQMRIDTTIVPWTSEWLFFYELWLFSGKWYGGGHGTPAPSGVPYQFDEQRAA